MPFPVAAAIGAGAALAGTGASIASTSNLNKKNRAFSEQMYARQHNDNIKFWQLQNQYNDPSAQMKRLKDAGLNPAMIYGGQGSGAAGQAATPSSPKPLPANRQTPNFDMLNSIGPQVQNSKLVNAQIERMRTQNMADLVSAAGKTFDNFQRKELHGYVMDAARLSNDQIQANTDLSIGRNERESYTTAQSLELGFEKILTERKNRARTDAEIKKIDSVIKQLKADTTLKNHENRLRKTGISFRDAIPYRMASQIVDYMIDPRNRKSAGQKLNKLLRMAQDGKLPDWITDPRWLDGK